MRQSKEVIKLIERAKELAIKDHIMKVGSEYLLLAMMEDEESACYFLLNDYDISISDIKDVLEEMIIIRKNFDEVSYTIRFQRIVENARNIALNYESQEVCEEHLFLSVLDVPSVARCILEKLDIDLETAMKDVKDIFNFDDREDFNSLTRNITKMIDYGQIEPFIGRNEYIERLDTILNRRTKCNPLLIGNAGVGKTAIVEGLAKYYYEAESNKEIVSLDLGLSIAGAKYRGDFEKRILDTIKEIEKNKNFILFIDEIHTIIGAGSSEGSVDAANLLKPILARRRIKCIGATTLEEYQKYIMNDKALARRFQPIFVSEPTIEETKIILEGIMNHYEDYHKLRVLEEDIDYIVQEAGYIRNRVFPDKAIDVLDEAMTYAKIKRQPFLTREIIDEAVGKITNVKKTRNFYSIKEPKLREFSMNRYLNIKRKNIATIKTNLFSLELKEDLKNGFGVLDEFVLEINFADYVEAFALSTLIGSPPGYVGYDGGGLLSEHITKYPLSVLVFDNFNCAHKVVKEFINNFLEKGYFNDKKGRKIDSNDCIFIFIEPQSKKKIGFRDEEKSIEKSCYDIVLEYKKVFKEETFEEKLREKGYDVKILSNNSISAIIELLSKYPPGGYIINERNEIIYLEKIQISG